MCRELRTKHSAEEAFEPNAEALKKLTRNHHQEQGSNTKHRKGPGGRRSSDAIDREDTRITANCDREATRHAATGNQEETRRTSPSNREESRRNATSNTEKRRDAPPQVTEEKAEGPKLTNRIRNIFRNACIGAQLSF